MQSIGIHYPSYATKPISIIWVQAKMMISATFEPPRGKTNSVVSEQV